MSARAVKSHFDHPVLVPVAGMLFGWLAALTYSQLGGGERAGKIEQRCAESFPRNAIGRDQCKARLEQGQR